MEENEFPKLDKSKVSIFSSFEEADEEDRKYWQSRTTYERLQHLELLRRINYGYDPNASIEKIIEVCERVGRDEVKVIQVIDCRKKKNAK
jgi:hypothetical protein